MADYETLLNFLEEYSNKYITRFAQAKHFYGNYHIQMVIAAAKEMSIFYKLNHEDHFILLCAAYFNCLGYLDSNDSTEHRSKTVEVMLDFFTGKAIENQIKNSIKEYIPIVQIVKEPDHIISQILIDANLFYLGSTQFEEYTKLMKTDTELRLGKEIDKDIWRTGLINLMICHHFYTGYAQEKLNKQKTYNLRSLENKSINSLTTKNKNKKGNENKPGRGIETMFRITSSNNQRLSDMADNKAHILLTVNSIILSAVIAVLFRKLDSNVHLIFPTFTLTIVVVVTMVMAILSTIPRIPAGTFSKKEIENKSVNLLFFGNFYKMNLDDYNAGMEKVMADSDFLYGMLTKDVYSQGVVLGRKYNILRYAYGVFMFGLVLSLISFIMVIIF